MSGQQAGLIIIYAGIGAVVLGVLVWAGALRWFGHLPGDFRLENDNIRVYFPLVSMIVISLVATIVVNLVRRLF